MISIALLQQGTAAPTTGANEELAKHVRALRARRRRPSPAPELSSRIDRQAIRTA
jgi:hypothetical protein